MSSNAERPQQATRLAGTRASSIEAPRRRVPAATLQVGHSAPDSCGSRHEGRSDESDIEILASAPGGGLLAGYVPICAAGASSMARPVSAVTQFMPKARGEVRCPMMDSARERSAGQTQEAQGAALAPALATTQAHRLSLCSP